MKVRIGSIEVIDPTWDELDELVERYGLLVQNGDSQATGAPQRQSNGQGADIRPADRVVLERFIEHGKSGVPTIEVGDVLGRRGKAIRPGLVEWAVRIGLIHDKTTDPFEDVRVGSKRGVRLKGSLTPVAQELLNRL